MSASPPKTLVLLHIDTLSEPFPHFHDFFGLRATHGSGRIRIPLTVQIRELKQASRSRFLTCTNPKSCFCMDSAVDDWVRDEYYLHRVTKMKYTPLIPAVLSRKLTGLKFVRSCVNTSETENRHSVWFKFWNGSEVA